MEDAALFFDKGLRESIENIVVCEGPFFGDLQWRLSSLPIRLGGLGLGPSTTSTDANAVLSS
ncbi:reverse transcriptase domain-containing protein [Artemisia annua]|uniref:Reverse transcriptase domain-containing protein n=1 Tax=Artemisia annua TaxID=35608 RepID=A0A2U1LZZ8_ARTAN|nr:reverse transcriptase domain-containing protein [Artemisia annua]